MTSVRFDPKKFFDRIPETEEFERLLSFEDQARILAIRDIDGNGKTWLLRKYKHRCLTTQPRTPVSLIELDQLPEKSPLMLINSIAKDLYNTFRIDFPNFKQHELARSQADFTFIRSSVYLQKANFNAAQRVNISGMMTNLEQANTVNINAGSVQLTPEQEELAVQASIEAFFHDLGTYCNRKPVVLIFDSYEQFPNMLKNWIMEYLLEQYFFDFENRPKHLLLVVAGQETPEFEQRWPLAFCEDIVCSINQLAKWTKSDIEACSQAYRCQDTRIVDQLYELYSISPLPTLLIVQVIQVGATIVEVSNDTSATLCQ